MKLKGSVVFLGQRGVVGRDRPACFFSVTVPLRWRISRSTRPNDMRPRVRPDMIPAKRTRKQEIPAQTNHHGVPKRISSAPKTMPFAAEFIFIIMDVNIIVVGVRWCGDYSTEETEPEIGSEKNKDRVCDCGSMCVCVYVNVYVRLCSLSFSLFFNSFVCTFVGAEGKCYVRRMSSIVFYCFSSCNIFFFFLTQ